MSTNKLNIGRELVNKDCFIIKDEVKHEYRDVTGNLYVPVTRLVETIKKPFDKETISRNVARSRIGWHTATPDQIDLIAEVVRQEWKNKNDLANEYGNLIHKICETYIRENGYLKAELVSELADVRGRAFDDIWNPTKTNCLRNTLHTILEDLKQYEEIFLEEVVYDKTHLVAGTMDLAAARTRKTYTIDIDDFKSNIAKGIQFDSIKRNELGKWDKHTGYMFIDAYRHMEEINYFTYCLQLATYAYTLLSHGFSVGRLRIRFINKDLHLETYPVPFMKYEVEKLFEINKNTIDYGREFIEGEDW